MKKNSQLLFGGIIIATVILSLLIVATPSFGSSEIELKEVINDLDKYEGRYVITQGFLIEESIKWNIDIIELRFDIKDDEGNILSVKHNGVQPDNFSEGNIVILEGNVNSDGNFTAERLQTKCPSKYEGQEESNYDHETHKVKTNPNIDNN